VLRQLEAILHIYRLARAGQTVDALRETIRLPFLHLDPKAPNVTVDIFRNLSPHVQACVPDLLMVALNCIDNVRDTDGTLRAVKTKVVQLMSFS
jgi:nuclear pore complex protein Nup93